jgi:type I restriction enzyme S subunit
MNAELLLAHYERIADAPDAMAHLRRFVLDLAVRGRLVPQDPCDEPASELFGRITAKAPRNTKSKNRQFDLSEPPFQLPSAWSWIPFGDIHELIRGVTYSAADVSEIPTGGYVPILRANNIGPVLTHDEPVFVKQNRVSDDQYLRAGDFMIALSSGSKNLVGKAAFVPKDYPEAFGGFCGVIRLIDPTLQGITHVYLQSDLYRQSISAGSRGIGINNLKKEKISNLFFPLPPAAEQRRIIRKVDELMALCDRLEAARTEREAARDRLTAASLARLNVPDPDTFHDDARFALDALPALTARADQIKQLRQTILTLAVRGKLVPQDPRDEEATELLKRTAVEIDTYSQEHGLTPTRAAPITDGEVPFVAPQGWKWARLSTLFRVITDGDHLPPPKSDDGVAFLTIGNITTGRLDFSGCRFVPTEYFKSLAPYRTPAKGDILYTVVGATYGRPALVETERQFCVQRHIAILKPTAAMNLRFLVWLLASPLIYDQATRSTTGTAQPTIALRPLRNFIVPIPPLGEQHRIVAKVDELMALCDRLEASLTGAADTRTRLLDALLAEALTPDEKRELEAAE